MSNVAMVHVPMCHPSVRIAGTENEYVPMLCTDQRCTSSAMSHMHCPFCVKVETYHDARILRAHYRVKHVDKGIQFAGLKILRCCEQCDIVGAIKGEKRFKGAHWHCYRCKNGFNRRDEAIKHYKTHFRHPYTTFQIHISQEVNNSFDCQERRDEDSENSNSFSTNSTVTSVILKNDEQVSPSGNSQTENSSDSSQAMTSNERMNDIAQPSEGQTAIMIIQGDHVEGAAINVNNSGNEIHKKEEDQLHKQESENATIVELKAEIVKLKEGKAKLESSFQAEIEQLKTIISKQEHQLDVLRKREQELTKELSAPTDDKIQQLMTSLQDQHAQLLREHLLQIRKEAFSTSSDGATPISPNSAKSSETDANQQVVRILFQENANPGMIRQTFPASYTLCVGNGEPKNELQQTPTVTNYLIAPEPSKDQKSVTSASDSNPKVLLVNQNAYKNSRDENLTPRAYECAENFVIPASACGNLVMAQTNVNEANGSVTFVMEEQLQNCIGAMVFNQNQTSPYLVINQKAENPIIGDKRKLYIAECPTEKKKVKSDS